MSHRSDLGFHFVRESGLWLSDTTEANATTARHGLLPKLSGNANEVFCGDGQYRAVSSGGGGTTPAAQPVSYTDRWWIHQADMDGTAYSTIGVDFVISGTGSSTADNDTDSRWIRTSTAASANATGQLQSITGILMRRRFRSAHVLRMKTYTDISSLRFWSGLFSSAPQLADDPTGDLAAFRYSTNAGDTEWMCCVKDGSTLSATASGVTVATDTMYLLWVETDDSEVRFYINETLVHTASANLPSIDQDMGFHVGMTTLTAAVRAWKYARQYGRMRG